VFEAGSRRIAPVRVLGYAETCKRYYEGRYIVEAVMHTGDESARPFTSVRVADRQKRTEFRKVELFVRRSGE
jgi:hypothetical protein